MSEKQKPERTPENKAITPENKLIPPVRKKPAAPQKDKKPHG